MVLWAMSKSEERRGGRAYDDTQRSVSIMRITVVQTNGHIHTGKQNHRCKVCGRAFVSTPENSVITEQQRALIERLLLERISLRGICRAVGVGLQWPLQFMSVRFQAAPEDLHVKLADNPRR
jgi:ribosomal protein S14